MLQLSCFCVLMSLFLLCCSLLVVLRIVREKSSYWKFFINFICLLSSLFQNRSRWWTAAGQYLPEPHGVVYSNLLKMGLTLCSLTGECCSWAVFLCLGKSPFVLSHQGPCSEREIPGSSQALDWMQSLKITHRDWALPASLLWGVIRVSNLQVVSAALDSSQVL